MIARPICLWCASHWSGFPRCKRSLLPQPWLVPNTGYERSRTATCFSGKSISRLSQSQTWRKAWHAWTAYTRAGPQINWLLFTGEPIALMQSRPRRSFNPTQKNRLLTLALTLPPTIGPAFKSLVGNDERLAEALKLCMLLCATSAPRTMDKGMLHSRIHNFISTGSCKRETTPCRRAIHCVSAFRGVWNNQARDCCVSWKGYLYNGKTDRTRREPTRG